MKPGLAATALVVTATLGLAWAAGFGSVLRTISRPQAQWVGAIIVLQAAAFFGYAIAYRIIFYTSYKRALGRTLTGFSPFVIRGGFTYDAAVGSRKKVTLLLLWEYVGLVPLAYVAAVLVLTGGYGVPDSFSVPWIIGVPAGISVAAATTVYRRQLAQDKKRLLAILNLLPVLARSFKSAPGAVIFASLAVYWAAEMAAVWAALRLYGVHMPAAAIAIGYATGYVLSRRSLPLAGAGVVLAFLTLALHFVGAPLAGALAAIFSYYLLSLLLPLLAHAQLRNGRGVLVS